MSDTFKEIIDKIKALENELAEEISQRQEEFFYQVNHRKIKFAESARRLHKQYVIHVFSYLRHARIAHILTAPIIWFGLLPALFLDLFISTYQILCFPVYKIPKVKRADYIVIDRQYLAYLNVIEKANCIYCGYFIGLIAYTQEITARTEQYWCPIKHASKLEKIHSRYEYFVDYGDAKNYRARIKALQKDFDDLREQTKKD